jgi:hypothetical protein
MMKAKHERLDTNALVLASRSGFTPEARAVAHSYGIEVFTLEEVETADIPRMLGSDGTLLLKSVAISVERVRVRVAQVGEMLAETVVTSPDNLIHSHDEAVVCQIQELVGKMLNAPYPRDYLLRESTLDHQWFELAWEPPIDDKGLPLYMKKIDPDVLRPIECIHVFGPCKVEIGRFGMRHGRIGSVSVSWGKVAIGGRDAMAVATVENTGATKLSITISGSQ